MLYAVKPSPSPLRPSTALREPTPTGGHDSDDMRQVLLTALHTFARKPLPMSQLRTYANYLETMAFAGPTRWFGGPSNLAWAWREYFDLADRVEQQLSAAAPEPESEATNRVLVSAMTLLTSRVLAFASQEARRDPSLLSVPLIATATRASSRTRRWCRDDEPGKSQMMGVLSYSVIDVAALAVERLTHDETCTGDLVRETTGALDEVLATLKQLASQYPTEAYFDEGLGAHQTGQPSRSVRALQGLAWSHDVLGQAGVLPPQKQLQEALSLLEQLWHPAHERPNERRGLVRTAAHLTSAWSTVLEADATTRTDMGTRCLWLARQASAAAAEDLVLAHAVLDVTQSVAAIGGISLKKGGKKGARLALHAADVARNVMGRGNVELNPEALAGTIENLSQVATEAIDRKLPEAAELAAKLRVLMSLSAPAR